MCNLSLGTYCASSISLLVFLEGVRLYYDPSTCLVYLVVSWPNPSTPHLTMMKLVVSYFVGGTTRMDLKQKMGD